MSALTTDRNLTNANVTKPALSRSIVRRVRAFGSADLTPELIAKVKIALLDMLSCAYESQDLSWSQQSMKMATRGQGPAHIFGTSHKVTMGDAAFVNAVLGHGLVREDMHTGSVSHLGVIIFPTLLAMAETRKCSGQEFILAAITGYETGCVIGKSVMDAANVRQYRPTGITGPLAGAIAGARLWNLTEDQTVSALGFAANSTVGLNEWPHSGGDDMFFHVGFAARNAVNCVEIAELGANGSESALDGQAGLFAALRKTNQIDHVIPFGGPQPEIFEVFHKPAPACNYAQTATQASAQLAAGEKIDSNDITAITVKCTAAAANYPGCNYAGPFRSTLQAKMSIQFCVAAALKHGVIEESNYRILDDEEIARLASITKLEIDPALSAAYPGKQGGAVIVTLKDGRWLATSLADIVPATPEQIRARFRKAMTKVMGAEKTSAAEAFIDTLEQQPDIGQLCTML